MDEPEPFGVSDHINDKVIVVTGNGFGRKSDVVDTAQMAGLARICSV